MKDKSKFNIILFIMAIAYIILGISLANLYPIAKDYFDSKKILSYAETKDCEDLDLIDTSFCLREKLLPIYKYNISNVGKKLTDEQLIKEGGVCSSYSDWYEKRANSLGYYSKGIVISVNPEFDHKFAIISDNSGYCVLDQMNVKCFSLRTLSEEENETLFN
jgi:hypothetical protein